MPSTPRQRARAETEAEIKRIARRQVGESGPAGLSLREIAKEMGLVSSAVYRYVASRDELLTQLIADAYDRLGESAESADAALARDDLAGRWRALANSLRAWARAQPSDYTLVYGPPVPGYVAPAQTFAPAQRWIEIMIDILVRAGHDDAPAPTDPDLRTRLERLRDSRAPGASPGAIAAGLRAWVQLHGLVSLEIHGQLDFVLGAGGDLFGWSVEQQIEELGLAGARPD